MSAEGWYLSSSAEYQQDDLLGIPMTSSLLQKCTTMVLSVKFLDDRVSKPTLTVPIDDRCENMSDEAFQVPRNGIEDLIEHCSRH